MDNFKVTVIRNVGVAAAVFGIVLAGALSISLGVTGHLGGNAALTQPTPGNESSTVETTVPTTSQIVSTITIGSTRGEECTAVSVNVTNELGATGSSFFAGGLAYDSVDNKVFVLELNASGAGQSRIIVVSGLNLSQVIGTIPIGNYSADVAFDPVNDTLYVSEYGSGRILIIDASNDTIIGKIPDSSGPILLSYDHFNNEIYVLNSRSDSITVIDGYSNKAVTNITFPAIPLQLAYYPSFPPVTFVTAGNSLFEMNSTNQIFANLTVGPGFTQIAPDNLTGDLYLASDSMGRVLVVSPLPRMEIFKNISLPLATNAIAYDPQSSEIFAVTNGTGGILYVIDSLSNQVVKTLTGLQFSPVKFVYDSFSSELLLSSSEDPLYGVSASCSS